MSHILKYMFSIWFLIHSFELTNKCNQAKGFCACSAEIQTPHSGSLDQSKGLWQGTMQRSGREASLRSTPAWFQ